MLQNNQRGASFAALTKASTSGKEFACRCRSAVVDKSFSISCCRSVAVDQLLSISRCRSVVFGQSFSIGRFRLVIVD
jgi:hypothetical protein